MSGYVMKRKHGHIEVFLNGDFVFSADTVAEADEEILRLDRSADGVYNEPRKDNFISLQANNMSRT